MKWDLISQCSYLDRINFSNARLAGMQSDLRMTDTVWSAGISLFYVGYIISQVPATVLIANSKPSIIFPSIMLAWSAVTICMSALSSGWGFCLCRFLVGFAEGPFVPAFFAAYFVLVYEERVTVEDGYLACREYHLECVFKFACCRDSHEYEWNRGSAFVAMVYPSGGYCEYPGGGIRVLVYSKFSE